ncbi:hypothetical protein EIP91_008711 [Steccherinum ochraceum]|uniref:Uncharacterized protein n=1 Tax=Steccherinum ochraceum TaxID=92696 RepID=A0A4R0RFU5_9APHY|nr:hypothetical protein EIP91_008711 [Steccherinum ochraceum]
MHPSAILTLVIATSAAPVFSAPLAIRAPAEEESGAFDTGIIRDAVDIGNSVIQGIQGVKDLFTNNNENYQRREDFEELFSRSADDDESGAFKVNTGLIQDAVDIGNGIIQGAQGIKDLITGQPQYKRHEYQEFLARRGWSEGDELVARGMSLDELD